jgi:Fur family ferric uptake transcriptional regulator
LATLKGKAKGRRRAQAIERACRDRGLRMTGQRRVIARILDEAVDHPDVVELHRRAARVDGRISLSTVYRTVKLFETEGIIERLEFRGGRSRYEQAAREHHDHLINLETGAVIEFRSEEIEALQTEIARRLGYRLVFHRLELYAVPLDSPSTEGGE